MKKISLLCQKLLLLGVLIFIFGSTVAHGQSIDSFNVRCPYYFYTHNFWDSLPSIAHNWHDNIDCVVRYYGELNLPLLNDRNHFFQTERDTVGLGCYSDSVIKVIGVAISERDLRSYMIQDTSLDYYRVRLYQPQGNDMVLSAEKRFFGRPEDSLSGAVMTQGVNCRPYYNLFFDSSVVIQGDFFISISLLKTQYHGVDKQTILG